MSRLYGLDPAAARRVGGAVRYVEKLRRGTPPGRTRWDGQAQFPAIPCKAAAGIPAAVVAGDGTVTPGGGTVEVLDRETGPTRYVPSGRTLAAENLYTIGVPSNAAVVWVSVYQGTAVVLGWDCP